ncbi:hypothetical protein Tco_1430379 [Tanacetum coccineum]
MGVFGGVEKVRALRVNGVAEGSTIGVVWFKIYGGMMRARVVSMVVLGLSFEEQALVAMDFESTRVIRKRCLQVLRCEDDGRLVEEALEQALSLFEFRGFSPFNGRKLVHVVNGIKSVVTHGIIFHSLVWRRDHDMVHKLEIIGQGEWLFGLDILKNPSEKHGIRESHFATLSRTYHSMSDIVSKIEVFANGETIEHVAQGCIRVIFVTGEAYGIFTNDGVPPLEFIS